MYDQTAFRINKTVRTMLIPVGNTPNLTWSPQLVFGTGYFAYNTPVYDLTQPGLYIFSHYITATENWSNRTHMIVYNGDPVTLLQAACWISTWGDRDDSLAVATLNANARSNPVQLLCGPLHSWVKSQLLTPQSVVSRTVYFVTMDTPNNMVDGHQCLEVTIGGNRALVDLSNNVIFTDGSGNRLTADAAVDAIAANTFSYEFLALDSYSFEPANDKYDASLYAAMTLATEADKKIWHRRIFQAIGMENGAEIWFKVPSGTSSAKITWLESLDVRFKVKTEAVFDATFYP